MGEKSRPLSLFAGNALGRGPGTGDGVSHSRGELGAGGVQGRSQSLGLRGSNGFATVGPPSEFHADLATILVQCHGGIDDIAQDGQEGDGDEDSGAFGHEGKIIRYRILLGEPAVLIKGGSFPRRSRRSYPRSFPKDHRATRRKTEIVATNLVMVDDGDD